MELSSLTSPSAGYVLWHTMCTLGTRTHVERGETETRSQKEWIADMRARGTAGSTVLKQQGRRRETNGAASATLCNAYRVVDLSVARDVTRQTTPRM